MRKIIFGGLLASTMLVPAFAQNNPPASSTPSAQPSTPPAASSSATVAPKAQGDMWRASKLIGLNVYNDQNEKLGDISEILLDKSGKVDGVVIGVGGFLGMGKHDILVQLDKLKFVNEPVKTSTTSATTGTTRVRRGAPGDEPERVSQRVVSKTINGIPTMRCMSGATKELLKSMAEFKFD